ncbi:HK97-gp10 family putative phage morphogenesis protein [Oceanobacillus sp. FSL W8-0428]|uniref:HK97-gp10 family putative phage morphogenesis protein n=1 Tax=Oceanobacillus sp. FSL W8-0428 TaxID=2921715 RepID=UPI0030F6FFDE
MSVKVRGEAQLIAELEKRLGKSAMNRISDDALKKGANVFVKELQRQFSSWKDTGASYDEITVSDIIVVNGVRTIKIHWRGPDNRYRIIHLNEWGTVKNPNPAGKGAVARAMRNAQNEYRRVIKEAVRRGI